MWNKTRMKSGVKIGIGDGGEGGGSGGTHGGAASVEFGLKIWCWQIGTPTLSNINKKTERLHYKEKKSRV